MYKHFLKPLTDFAIALIAIPFFILLWIPIAIAIKIEDGGPILYCGQRIGKNGKVFRMCKFRSMKVNAPDIRLDDGSTYNGEDDPRVTRVGRFLRKTSLDEVPQLLNILTFRMSIIGPRPDPPDWLDKYREEDKGFLRVRPGITGYNQAYYRNDANAELKIRNDNYYAEKISLWMDIKIFFKTIQTVLRHENVYVDLSKDRTVADDEQPSDETQSAIEACASPETISAESTARSQETEADECGNTEANSTAR